MTAKCLNVNLLTFFISSCSDLCKTAICVEDASHVNGLLTFRMNIISEQLDNSRKALALEVTG